MLASVASGLVSLVSAFFRVFAGQRCRFYPSCSSYAQEALREYPAVKAFAKIFSRLIRCHPFSPGGYDPLRKV